MPLYNYLTPKLDFKRKFNHRQLFLYKGRLTVRTIRKFRIGSSLRIESRIGSSIRNRIESRSFAGPYLKHNVGRSTKVHSRATSVGPMRGLVSHYLPICMSVCTCQPCVQLHAVCWAAAGAASLAVQLLHCIDDIWCRRRQDKSIWLAHFCWAPKVKSNQIYLRHKPKYHWMWHNNKTNVSTGHKSSTNCTNRCPGK